jgi:hypothetical protein
MVSMVYSVLGYGSLLRSNNDVPVSYKLYSEVNGVSM